ncbi:MAG TPA: hypothetical protein VKH43_03725 [Thermoanaerobaculia bacterium]|nr:hypothetical protein [Thermoanaerobaculia bacterium]
MPLQNRVDPYGRLHAVPERGAWMGNRGVLHNEAKEIVARWRSPRWITCVLEFRGRRREVFAPHRYSELFFLDEATSLAAGHRPCAECRKSRFKDFRAAWAAGRSDGVDFRPPTAGEMDRVLHSERLLPGGGKRTYQAALSSLPAGVIVEHGGNPHLIRAGKLRPWSFAGYGLAAGLPATTEVTVLTPRSIVRAIAAGFQPQVHGE